VRHISAFFVSPERKRVVKAAIRDAVTIRCIQLVLCNLFGRRENILRNRNRGGQSEYGDPDDAAGHVRAGVVSVIRKTARV
jgi:hypothetical protein